MIGMVIWAGAFLQACESDKDQYSGFSDLVAERNEARKIISGENREKKKVTKNAQEERPKSDVREKKSISKVVLYEKSIDIVDSESRLPLARGVAYLNKSGQIVRIKIIDKK